MGQLRNKGGSTSRRAETDRVSCTPRRGVAGGGTQVRGRSWCKPCGQESSRTDRVKDPNFTDDRRETDLSRRLAQSTGRVGQARARAAHPTHLLTPQRNEVAPGRARPPPRAPCLSKAGSDKPRPALARPPRRPGRSVCVRSSLRGEHVRGSAGREQIAVVSVARDAAGRPALARSA